MRDYAITIRKHSKKNAKVTEKDYDSVIMHLKQYMQYYVFENDKGKDHVHLHGLITIPANMFRKKLLLDGFNMKIVAITNSKGWLDYCNKDKRYRKKISFELEVQSLVEDHSD